MLWCVFVSATGIQQKYLLVTCNYPARARGVTKLMGVTEAKKKCPELVLVSGEDLTRYREMSYKISGVHRYFRLTYCILNLKQTFVRVISCFRMTEISVVQVILKCDSFCIVMNITHWLEMSLN